ncbi:MAG: archaeal flagellar protein FlaJ [Candidatus Diapherotrites archaeon]|nr:archaeal flagellar protein FlaJ [Candidatus Diapherotrites archaeon]MDN5366728.1 archaeal flagellar protein FlaJ [Candidatus Diapherotrites archaeon]
MASLTRTLQEKLLKAGLRTAVEDYLTRAALILLLATVLVYVLFHPRPSGLALFVLFGILVIVYLPFRLARVRAECAEAEMPYVLRTLASEVEAGVPYMTALEDAARSGKVLGRAIKEAIALYKKGIPVERALKSVGESFESERVQRAFMHMGILYQSGKEASAVKKMADEMISIHRAEAKRFSAELALYTLIFIAVAALIPALFEMYVAVGSLFLSLTVTPEQAFYIPAVIMPALSGMVLAWIYLKLPSFMRR